MHCYKGLCDTCAVNIGEGLACRGSCEAATLEFNDVHRRITRFLDYSMFALAIAISFSLLMVVLLIFNAFYHESLFDKLAHVIATVSLVLYGVGISLYLCAEVQIRRRREEDHN